MRVIDDDDRTSVSVSGDGQEEAPFEAPDVTADVSSAQRRHQVISAIIVALFGALFV